MILFFVYQLLLYVSLFFQMGEHLFNNSYKCNFNCFVYVLISMNSENYLIYTTLVSLTFGTLSYLPHWLNWNFSGYETKNNWADITTLYEGLDTLDPGRIMWEPNSDLNKYGTPMVLMTIPMFTDTKVWKVYILIQVLQHHFIS